MNAPHIIEERSLILLTASIMKRYKSKEKINLSSVALTLIPLSFVPCIADAQTIPIAVSASQNLHFGFFYTNGSTGDVIIDTAGSRSFAGGAVGIVGAGLESRGELSITGSTGAVVTIAFTAPNFNIVNGTGNVLVVDNFQLDTPTGGSTITKTLATSPTIVPFGATLNVPSGSDSGTYTGTYGISVVYQ